MPLPKPFDLSLVTERQLALFEAKIERAAGCWLWTGCTKGRGYGRVTIGHGNARQTVMAHRLAWMLAHPNMVLTVTDFICHHCDNPPCCRPDHLFRGTARDNARDMIGKGRQGYCAHPGESHPLAKFTERDVRAIRASGDTLAVLAAHYDVSMSAIWSIKKWKTWAHVK